MTWLNFLARRGVGLIATLAGVVVAAFLLVQLVPGDPALRIVGLDAAPGRIEVVRSQLGLDESVGQQFVSYVTHLFSGNLGTSFVSGERVTTILGDRTPATLELAGLAALVVCVISFPVGILLGSLTFGGGRPRLEGFVTAALGATGSVPSYVYATLLVFLFAVHLQLLPAAGSESLQSAILPVAAIALAPSALLIRLIRVETMEVLGRDYITTARSKRVGTLRLYRDHVLPNVLTSGLTVGGVILTSLVGGTVIIENVFAWPGLGTALISAVNQRDYPVIQGELIVLGLIVVVVNMAVDVAVGIANPVLRKGNE